MDNLKELFKLQKKLRKKIGNGRDILDSLTEKQRGEKVYHLIQALRQEFSEIQDCLIWKWWSREYKDGQQHKIIDLAHLKEEIIDVLFFYFDMCKAIGLDNPKKIMKEYKAKHKINMDRQDNNYKQIKKKNV